MMGERLQGRVGDELGSATSHFHPLASVRVGRATNPLRAVALLILSLNDPSAGWQDVAHGCGLNSCAGRTTSASRSRLAPPTMQGRKGGYYTEDFNIQDFMNRKTTKKADEPGIDPELRKKAQEEKKRKQERDRAAAVECLPPGTQLPIPKWGPFDLQGVLKSESITSIQGMIGGKGTFLIVAARDISLSDKLKEVFSEFSNTFRAADLDTAVVGVCMAKTAGLRKFSKKAGISIALFSDQVGGWLNALKVPTQSGNDMAVFIVDGPTQRVIKSFFGIGKIQTSSLVALVEKEVEGRPEEAPEPPPEVIQQPTRREKRQSKEEAAAMESMFKALDGMDFTKGPDELFPEKPKEEELSWAAKKAMEPPTAEPPKSYLGKEEVTEGDFDEESWDFAWAAGPNAELPATPAPPAPSQAKPAAPKSNKTKRIVKYKAPQTTAIPYKQQEEWAFAMESALPSPRDTPVTASDSLSEKVQKVVQKAKKNAKKEKKPKKSRSSLDDENQMLKAKLLEAEQKAQMVKMAEQMAAAAAKPPEPQKSELTALEKENERLKAALLEEQERQAAIRMEAENAALKAKLRKAEADRLANSVKAKAAAQLEAEIERKAAADLADSKKAAEEQKRLRKQQEEAEAAAAAAEAQRAALLAEVQAERQALLDELESAKKMAAAESEARAAAEEKAKYEHEQAVAAGAAAQEAAMAAAQAAAAAAELAAQQSVTPDGSQTQPGRGRGSKERVDSSARGRGSPAQPTASAKGTASKAQADGRGRGRGAPRASGRGAGRGETAEEFVVAADSGTYLPGLVRIVTTLNGTLGITQVSASPIAAVEGRSTSVSKSLSIKLQGVDKKGTHRIVATFSNESGLRSQTLLVFCDKDFAAAQLWDLLRALQPALNFVLDDGDGVLNGPYLF